MFQLPATLANAFHKQRSSLTLQTKYSPLAFISALLSPRPTNILDIPLIRRISGGEFLSPYNGSLFCNLFMFVANRTNQSDHFFWSSYESGPIRLFVLITFEAFRVTKVCLVNKRYVSVWLPHRGKSVAHHFVRFLPPREKARNLPNLKFPLSGLSRLGSIRGKSEDGLIENSRVSFASVGFGYRSSHSSHIPKFFLWLRVTCYTGYRI